MVKGTNKMLSETPIYPKKLNQYIILNQASKYELRKSITSVLSWPNCRGEFRRAWFKRVQLMVGLSSSDFQSEPIYVWLSKDVNGKYELFFQISTPTLAIFPP